jgi:hypothetical protein
MGAQMQESVWFFWMHAVCRQVIFKKEVVRSVDEHSVYDKLTVGIFL